jgi:hypothetical protein
MPVAESRWDGDEIRRNRVGRVWGMRVQAVCGVEVSSLTEREAFENGSVRSSNPISRAPPLATSSNLAIDTTSPKLEMTDLAFVHVRRGRRLCSPVMSSTAWSDLHGRRLC